MINCTFKPSDAQLDHNAISKYARNKNKRKKDLYYDLYYQEPHSVLNQPFESITSNMDQNNNRNYGEQ